MIEYGMDTEGENVVLFFGPIGPDGYATHYVFTLEGAQQYLAHLTEIVTRCVERKQGAFVHVRESES